MNQRLRELRIKHGLSQEALADALAVSRQTVSKWETGVVRPSADNLARLGQLYGLPVDALLRDGPPDEPAPESPEPPEAAGPEESPAQVRRPSRRTVQLTAVALVVLAMEIVIALASAQDPAGSPGPAPALSLDGPRRSASAALAARLPALSGLPPEQLAALDLWALPALQDLILDARSQFIFRDRGWTVDGAVSVLDLETGQVTPLPEFSDLFPGWDPPSTSQIGPNDSSLLRAGETDTLTMFSLSPNPVTAGAREDAFDRHINALFRLPGEWLSDEIFASILGNGNPFAVFPQTDPREGAVSNIKAVDRSRGTVIGWAPGLSMGQALRLSTQPHIYYGFNGGVFDPEDAGWRAIRITDDPGIAGAQ